MSLTNHKALEVPNSWVDSYINQYDLDSCFKIVKKIELKEENEWMIELHLFNEVWLSKFTWEKWDSWLTN